MASKKRQRKRGPSHKEARRVRQARRGQPTRDDLDVAHMLGVTGRDPMPWLGRALGGDAQ